MSIITVSGEMGAKRDELAEEVGRRGGLEIVDRRTLMEAVDGLVDLSRDEHQLLAEQGPAMLDMNNRRRRLFAAFLEYVVLEYAQKGKVVLVGRGANLLLRRVPGVLKVRTVAPLEARTAYLAESQQLEMDPARQLATVVDQQRRTYIAHLFGADWTSPLNYDLVLNTGSLSLEQAASTVLGLAAHEEFQPGAEANRLLGDLVLAAKVRRELVGRVDIHGLEVQAKQGVVTLTGFVATPPERGKAEDLCRQLLGVDGMQSELEISPAMSRFMP